MSSKDLASFSRSEWKTIVLSLEYQRILFKGQLQYMKEGTESVDMAEAIDELELVQLEAEKVLFELDENPRKLTMKDRIVKFVTHDPVLFFASWLGLLIGWVIYFVGDILRWVL